MKGLRVAAALAGRRGFATGCDTQALMEAWRRTDHLDEAGASYLPHTNDTPQEAVVKPVYDNAQAIREDMELLSRVMQSGWADVNHILDARDARPDGDGVIAGIAGPELCQFNPPPLKPGRKK